jgi:tartrate dehydrogenase/decarboxylase/D-malate dehydrogenase
VKNTEGEYSSIGGKAFLAPTEFVLQESVFEASAWTAFSLRSSWLQSRPKTPGPALPSPTVFRSPCQKLGRTVNTAKATPHPASDKFHIDILTAHFVQRPDFFDVVVAGNLFETS